METSLTIKGTQKFMGVDIPIIVGGFGEGQKVVTAKSVSEIHQIDLKTINQAIGRLVERERLKNGIDFIDLLSTEELKVTASYLGTITSNGQKHSYILSERGYTKLIKYMDDDKSWEVMDEFVDSYFRLREAVKIALSEEDDALLKIAHAESGDEIMLACKHYRDVVTKPLLAEVDRYSRFLCDKLEALTKTQLATKLDTSPQTLAAILKRENVYTPKGSKVAVDFLNKYPNIKMVKETVNTYKNSKTDKIVEETDWQWTYEGAKILVDFLIEKGYVTFCENAGFKLIKKSL